MAVTPRFGYTIRGGTDTPDVIRELLDTQNRNEAVGALFSQGTLAARPAAAAGNAGMFYRVTDQGRTGIGVVYFSTGSAWVVPEPLVRTVSDLVSPGFSPVDGDEVVFAFTGGTTYAGRILRWKLRYDGTTGLARRWIPVGTELLVYTLANAVITGPLNAVTNGALTIPAPGKYLCRIKSSIAAGANAPVTVTVAGRAWPGSGAPYHNASDDDGIFHVVGTGSDARGTLISEFVFTATSTGQVDLMAGISPYGSGISATLTSVVMTLEPLELGV
jgi:hypothetical protein